MRLSALVNKNRRVVPDSIGTMALDLWDREVQEEFQTKAPSALLVRLPRRLEKYLRTSCDSYIKQRLHDPVYFNHLALQLLEEMSLSEALDQSGLYLRAAKAWRTQFHRAWRVGDPCYVWGEGQGNLFFIQEIQGRQVVVNGCWESKRKLVRLSFRDVSDHLETETHNIAAWEGNIRAIRETLAGHDPNRTHGRALRDLEQKIAGSREVVRRLEALLWGPRS